MSRALGRAGLMALVATAVVALASCSAFVGGSAAPASPSQAASAAPGASWPPSPVDGIVVHVESAGLTDVRGFDLRMVDGTVLAFTIGTVDNPTQFPPGHLAEHLATASPVRVWFRVVGGAAVVYRLEDALP